MFIHQSLAEHIQIGDTSFAITNSRIIIQGFENNDNEGFKKQISVNILSSLIVLFVLE